MREYGQIQCSFWANPEVQGLSDQGKLLATYLLTGPHSNGLGCYRLPDGYVQADFGWGPETVKKRFRELFEMGFCIRCETTNFVLIHDFLRWNPIANPNVAKSRQREFESVPKQSLIHKHLAAELLENGNHWANGFETVLKGFAEQDPTLPRPDPDPTPPEGDAPDADATDAAEGEDDPVCESIPLQDGSEHHVRQSDVREYERLYPAVDVHQEIRSMRGWCESNPTKRKTRRGAKAFITNWLVKRQDRGGSLQGAPNGTANPGHNQQRPQSAAERFWARRSGEVIGHG